MSGASPIPLHYHSRTLTAPPTYLDSVPSLGASSSKTKDRGHIAAAAGDARLDCRCVRHRNRHKYVLQSSYQVPKPAATSVFACLCHQPGCFCYVLERIFPYATSRVIFDAITAYLVGLWIDLLQRGAGEPDSLVRNVQNCSVSNVNCFSGEFRRKLSYIST